MYPDTFGTIFTDQAGGQAGWNAFYVGLKANRQVYTNITSMAYIPLETCLTNSFGAIDKKSPVPT